MGVNSSKKYEKSNLNLSKFSSILSKVCGSQEKQPISFVNVNKVEELWNSHLSKEHLRIIMDYFLREKLTTETFIQLYLNLIEGAPDDKMSALLSMLQMSQVVKKEYICEYVKAVIKSAFKILEHSDAFKNWIHFSKCKDFYNETSLCDYIMENLHCEDDKLDEQEVASWFYRSTMFNELSDFVYNKIYEIPSNDIKIPKPVATKNGGETILSGGEVIFFSLLLQKDFVQHWRLLFSTTTGGQSWATLCKAITAQGPTLIIIRSENDSVIGGFASNSWNMNPNFFGDDYSFILQLRPSISTFEATNYNKNFQYFNSGQATLPNGLGMGGQFDYWGFFINSDFGKCKTSETCTTFKRYKLKNLSKEFVIKDLEVWGVGKADPTPAELGERSSCLDKDPTASALLEMAGKKIYSADIRQQKPVDEEKDLDG